jgi:putative Mn2+ efflux pump MntP
MYSFTARTSLSPVITAFVFNAKAHSINLSSSGSFLIIFILGVFVINRMLNPVEKRDNSSSSSYSFFKPILRKTSIYSSRIALDRQRVIFSFFHRSIIFRGFPPKKDVKKLNAFTLV